MCFTQSVQWLQPFYHAVKPLLGEHRLDRVYGYKVRRGHIAEANGRTIWHSDGRIHITLLTHARYRQKGRWHEEPLTIAHILQTFAHELAHLKYEHHDSHHWALCCQLQLQFINTLELLGYDDTEAYHAPKER